MQKTFANRWAHARLVLGAVACALQVAACGGDDGGSGASVTGTAASGAAIAAAGVQLKCADGSTASGTTGSDGKFTLTVSGPLPCLLEVGTGTGKLHSAALPGGTSPIVANVTPLSEAVIGKISADTAALFSTYDATAAAMVTSAAIAAAQKAVAAELAANGVTVPATVSDFVAGTLVAAAGSASGNDYDKLLDAVGAKSYAIKIIGMNDFHGNIQPPAATNGGSVVLPDPAKPAGTTVNVGGAAYLATAIKALRAQGPNSIVAAAGDVTGASPFASSITHDEASIDVLNQIGLEVTSVGNHEFDYGTAELLRKQNGGCFPAASGQGVAGSDTCFMDKATGTYAAGGGSFSGAKYKYLSANVVDKGTGKPLVPATFIKRFGPIAVGFIGLTLQGTTQLVSASGIASVNFLEESAVINSYAKAFTSAGVQAVVVLIHQGGVSTATTVNDKSCPVSFGDLGTILDKLSADVDVVVSGHTHQEYVCNYKGKASGKTYLVTQTGFYGGAVTDINLSVSPGKGVTAMGANTVPIVQADNNGSVTVPAAFQAFQKDAAIDALVTNYVNVSKVIAQQPVGSISANLMRALFTGTTNRDESAEGAMGGVMADAYLFGAPGQADFAVTNPGGVRADITCAAGATPPCPVTYAQVNTVAPFANTLVTAKLTGAQVIRLLEQQWEAPNCTAKFNPATFQYGRLLQVSSTLTYTFDNSVAPWTSGAQPTNCAAAGTGHRVVASSVKINGKVLDPAATYTLVTNNFLGLGSGGDNFSVIATQGTAVTDTKILDLDAMIAYFRGKSPVAPPTPRITRIN